MPATSAEPIPTNTAMFAMLSDIHGAGHAVAALMGDTVARDYVVPDYLEEQGWNMVPFAVGEKHLIETETLYYVGEIAEIVGGFVVLENASWVHRTGRLSVLCARKSFAARGWPDGAQRPRTEYVGRQIVSLSKIVGSTPGDWILPTESIAI